MDLANLRKFLLCHYALAKFILKKIFPKAYTNEDTGVVAQIPIILLNILILTISIPVLIFFYCYKQIVISILKYCHKSNFVGLITGCDLLTSLNHEDGIVISAVFAINSKKNGEDLFQEISKRAWDEFTTPDLDKRMASIRKSFMGYLYYKEVNNLNPLVVLQRIRTDNDEISEEELTKFLHYHCNVKPLPLNGTFNWDFSLVTTPLRYTNGETRYLMIIRMHHYMVDGLTMYNLIKRLTQQHGDEVTYGDTLSGKLQTEQRKRTISSNINRLITYNTRAPISEESQLKYTPKSNGHLSILVEHTQNYVLKLKEIKNKIPGASFNSLILTAYSASLADYFKEFTPKNVKIPTKLEVVAPVQINMDRFSTYFGDNRKTKLGNDFTFLSVDVPIIPEDKINVPTKNYMMKRIKMICRGFQDYNKSIDNTLNYTLIKTYFEVFPTKIAYALLDYASYNILMSIFPGGPKLTLFQGDEIKNLFVTLPLRPNKIDMIFLTLTYDDKFHFVQVINENKFESIEKMDNVLKGILKYIDIMFEQFVTNKFV